MSTLSAAELRNRTLALLLEQSTMTLATTDGSSAWAAPVYFANIELHFYFFSERASRHIVESQSSHQTAAAIFSPASTWREIRGVQMSGTVQPISSGIEVSRGTSAYIKKFPFVREFFRPDQLLNLEAFSSRFKVRFYRFVPDTLYYLDNRVAFGFRAELPC